MPPISAEAVVGLFVSNAVLVLAAWLRIERRITRIETIIEIKFADARPRDRMIT